MYTTYLASSSPPPFSLFSTSSSPIYPIQAPLFLQYFTLPSLRKNKKLTANNYPTLIICMQILLQIMDVSPVIAIFLWLIPHIDTTWTLKLRQTLYATCILQLPLNSSSNVLATHF